MSRAKRRTISYAERTAGYTEITAGIVGFILNSVLVVAFVFYFATGFEAGLFQKDLRLPGLVALFTWLPSLGYHACLKAPHLSASVLGASLSTGVFLIIVWAGCTDFTVLALCYFGFAALGLFLLRRTRQASSKITS